MWLTCGRFDAQARSPAAQISLLPLTRITSALPPPTRKPTAERGSSVGREGQGHPGNAKRETNPSRDGFAKDGAPETHHVGQRRQQTTPGRVVSVGWERLPRHEGLAELDKASPYPRDQGEGAGCRNRGPNGPKTRPRALTGCSGGGGAGAASSRAGARGRRTRSPPKGRPCYPEVIGLRGEGQ